MLYPFTYDEVVEMSIRWKRFLSVAFNTHTPQHLLSLFLYHKEDNDCHGCKYSYGGHAELTTLSEQVYGHTHLNLN